MPGAFSFGAIGKVTVIRQTWRLLTERFGLEPTDLWVTYFAGDKVSTHWFDRDEETYQAWRNVGLPPQHIVGLGAGDNFWKQGSAVVGQEHVHKCGPTTEVFFDQGADCRCGPDCRPGCGCGRFVEFANTLFICFHIDDEPSPVRPLERPFTETVIGTERVAMLLQSKSSVFDIDSIRPLVEHVHRFCRQTHAHDPVNGTRSERVIIDHIRALLFLVADGAPQPGRGGRARLMRKLTRGTLTNQKLLGIQDRAFIPSLIDAALELYRDRHPHLQGARHRLLDYISEESQRFDRTIRAGQRQFNQLLRCNGDNFLSGEQALRLVKCHGFPLSLLEAALARKGIEFDRHAYREAHDRWRETVVAAN